MNKLKLGLGLLIFLLSFSMISAQTADEIIDNYHEVMGGKDKIASIKSSKAICKAKVQGMDLPVNMYQAAPGKQRLDINFQGQEITQMAFDGETGWQTNFMTMEAEAMDKEASEIMKSQSEFPDPFLTYKEKGYTLTLEGEEEVEGVMCHIIKLTRNPILIDDKEEENATLYFFDKEEFAMIMQRDFVLTGPQKGTSTETYYSDYDEVDGMYFPFTIVQRMNGQDVFNISIETIELNVEIPDDFYAMPEKG